MNAGSKLPFDRFPGRDRKKGIGEPVPRAEDPRLPRGEGRYSDDRHEPGQSYAIFVRSSHAHARLRQVDVAKAQAAPGVLSVLCGADYEADGMRPLPAQGNPKDVELFNRDGSPIFYPSVYPLVREKVLRVGEKIAMVIATSEIRARDAAELVEVIYEPLEAVADAVTAHENCSVQLWDQAPANVCVDDHKGDTAALEAAFARAAHVVKLDLVNNRVNGIPLEPRAATATYDPASNRYTLYAGGQGVNRFQRELATTFGLPLEHFRVISEDVGGGYGTRNSTYLEFILICWAARRVGRPVKWTATRSEAFVADYYGRDLFTRAELALDADGRFLALRTENIANLGTHAMTFVPIARGPTVMSGLYDIPVAETVTKGIFTNTVQTTAYRGAGRPEAIYVLERLVDEAARICGFDRIELRRHNLIEPHQLPYRNPLGVTYDSGDFPKSMEMALALADWEGMVARREAARLRGRLSGIGIANYVETSTGWPVEQAVMTVTGAGRVEVVIGTQSSGQGHETAFPQIVASLLDVPFESVRLVVGDTDRVKRGSGSHSTRSMRVGGHLLVQTSASIISRAKAIAAHRAGCRPDQIDYRDGRFSAPGSNRPMALFEIARWASELEDLPPALRGALRATADIETPLPAYPNGCHVAEVEVDPETGQVWLVDYTGVDDAGLVINPMLVDGQVHGGIVQGVGQALMELCVYDENAQPLCGSFMDYGLPRADEMPNFRLAHNAVATQSNLLGAKGGGEGGTTPAPAAVVNAVLDALVPYGVTDLDMPLTPLKVWEAIERARSGRG